MPAAGLPEGLEEFGGDRKNVWGKGDTNEGHALNQWLASTFQCCKPGSQDAGELTGPLNDNKTHDPKESTDNHEAD